MPSENQLVTPVICGRPDDLIPASKKNAKWILDYFRWIWYDYDANGNKKMFYANRGKYQEIKDYAMGKQSIKKYKPMLNVEEQDNETWMNIDFSIIPIYPKFRRIALSKVNKVRYNILATPIDAAADDEKNKKYAELKAKIKARQAFEAIGSPIAQQPMLQSGEKEPKDLEELEIMFKYNYKHQMAIEMEQGIKLVHYQNDYDQIQRQKNEDLIDFGVAIEKNWIDSNGSIRVRRVDPERFIVNACRRNDFMDKKYAGEVKEMTIGQLKQLAQDQFTAAEYEDIAKNVMGNFGNPNHEPSTGDLGEFYDNMKIMVLDAEFFSVNEIAHEKVVDKRGNLLIGNAYLDKKGKLRGELVRTSFRVVYEGQWIIGTKYMFNYGLKTNMKRSQESLGDTDMSYKIFAPDFYKMEVTSISDQVIPIIDQIQMDWYHLQNVKNQAIPKGIQIEMTSIENIPLGKGGAELQPMEVLDLFKSTGVLVWRRSDTSGSNAQELKPIAELNNGIGEDANFYFQSIQYNINLLKEIAGLNELTDASTPNAKTLTTVANMAYEATNNTLMPVIEGSKYLMEKTATDIMLSLQDLVSMGADVSGYIRSLGDTTIKFIKLSENLSNYEFGIMLEDQPTDQERQLLLQQADAALKADQIKYSDFVYIKSIDNLKQAEEILAYRIDKYAQQKSQQALAQIQANGQQQQQSAVIAEQGKQQTLQLEYQLKMQHLQLEKEFEMKLQEQKYGYELQLQESQNQAKIAADMIKVDSHEHIASERAEIDRNRQAPKNGASK